MTDDDGLRLAFSGSQTVGRLARPDPFSATQAPFPMTNAARMSWFQLLVVTGLRFSVQVATFASGLLHKTEFSQDKMVKAGHGSIADGCHTVCHGYTQ